MITEKDILIKEPKEYIDKVALIAQISFIERSQQRYMSNKLKELNLFLGEVKLIMPICANEGLSQEDLVKTFGLNKSTVANSLRSLEEQGYILRKVNPNNRRKNQIFATEKGKNLSNKFINYNLEWELKMGINNLNPIFREELAKLASKSLNDLNSY